MSNTKRLIELHKGIIENGAFLGIDKIKSWILKRVVLVHGCNFKAFDTKEQAKYFLTEGNDNIIQQSFLITILNSTAMSK